MDKLVHLVIREVLVVGRDAGQEIGRTNAGSGPAVMPLVMMRAGQFFLSGRTKMSSHAERSYFLMSTFKPISW